MLSAILIGNNIVNIALSSLATVFFIGLIGGNGATLSTVVVTVVVLIFGEITPKSVAKDYPEGFAKFSAPILRGLIFLLTPINYLFSRWRAMIGKILKTEANTAMSQEELLMLVDEVEEEDYEIPEDMKETEEDRLLDEKERESNQRFDKIMNWIWAALLVGVVAFLVWWVFF